MSFYAKVYQEREYEIDIHSKVIYTRLTIGKFRKRRSTGVVASSVEWKDSLFKGRVVKCALIPEEDLRKARLIVRRDILPELTRKSKVYSGKLVIDEFPKWMDTQTQWKPKSRLRCESAWNVLQQFFGEMRIDEVTEGHWTDFKAWLHRTHPHITRLSNLKKYFAQFFLYLFRKGMVPQKLQFHIPQESADPGVVLDNSQVHALIHKAKEIGDWRTRGLIAVGRGTGMRPLEMTLLEKSNLDFKNGFIKLRQDQVKAKTPARDIPLVSSSIWHRKALAFLRWRARVAPGKLVFGGYTDESKPLRVDVAVHNFKEVSTMADLPEVTLYDLRHTCATEFEILGVGPVIAARILGTSLEMYNKVYCKPKAINLRQSVLNAFGKGGGRNV